VIASDEIQVYAENSEPAAREWQLPQSGVRVKTEPQPLVDSAGITAARVVSLDLGPALVLDITPASAASITAHHAKRVVLVSHGRALGIARLSTNVPVSQISLFVEMPANELNAWVDSIAARLRHSDRSRAE
jgi:hypothetical protein